jgi:hypothetical protein
LAEQVLGRQVDFDAEPRENRQPKIREELFFWSEAEEWGIWLSL